jgi:hypothetical protein
MIWHWQLPVRNKACDVVITLVTKKKKNSILKLPTKEWHDKSGHS